MFEALEHHHTGPAGLDPAGVTMRRAGVLATGPLSAEASALLLGQTPQATIPCQRYRPLTAPAGDLDVPLYLSSPWYVDLPAARESINDAFDYSNLARYSSNSGAAIGITLPEALVHAINENIERDAFSILLARTFLGSIKHTLTVIAPDTLSEDLTGALRRAEQLAGRQVFMLDITTDLGVPTVFAYTPPDGDHPHYRGVGSSLSPHYAAWRALTELVQCLLGVAREKEPPRADLDGLRDYPALHSCAQLDLSAHLRYANYVSHESASEAPRMPQDHLAELISTLSAHGFTPYCRVLSVLPGEITTVHVLVPGLERFMLVTDGLLVLPGRRARSFTHD